MDDSKGTPPMADTLPYSPPVVSTPNSAGGIRIPSGGIMNGIFGEAELGSRANSALLQQIRELYSTLDSLFSAVLNTVPNPNFHSNIKRLSQRFTRDIAAIQRSFDDIQVADEMDYAGTIITLESDISKLENLYQEKQTILQDLEAKLQQWHQTLELFETSNEAIFDAIIQ